LKSFILLLILFLSTLCQESSPSYHDFREKRKKDVFSKIIQCIKENTSEKLKEILQNNGDNLREIAMSAGEISLNDRKAIRRCRDKWKIGN